MRFFQTKATHKEMIDVANGVRAFGKALERAERVVALLEKRIAELENKGTTRI